MQMNFNTFDLPTFIISVLVALGVRKLLAMAYAERNKRREERAKADKLGSEAHATNEGKMIDADQAALRMLLEDVKELKNDLKEMQAELVTVKEDRAELRADNKILTASEAVLKSELERQGRRIHDLAGDVQNRDKKVAELSNTLTLREHEITTLRSELDETRLELNALIREVRGNAKGIEGQSGREDR